MKRPIATLNLPVYKIQDLHSKGYMFVEDINIETIKSDTGITIDEWNKLTKHIQTKTALELCEDETIASHIVTFSSVVDDLFGGGVPIKMITEITGLPGSGKTQFCLQLSISVQLNDSFGGVDGQCVYIDSTLGFNTDRLKNIAKGCIDYCQNVAQTYNSFEMYENLKNLTVEKFLNNIHYLKVVQFIELLSSINILRKLLSKKSNIKLIIIDSITCAIKNTNIEYFERIKLIYTFLSDLQKLAQEYKFAIVLTNEMTTKIDANGDSYITPCLGDSFAHIVNTRIKLDRLSDDTFKATLLKSILKPATSATFKIVEQGMRDI